MFTGRLFARTKWDSMKVVIRQKENKDNSGATQKNELQIHTHTRKLNKCQQLNTGQENIKSTTVKENIM